MKPINKNELFYNLMYSRHCYKEIGSILSKLDTINYAIIKGEVLSKQAYKIYGYRRYNDIDILIHRNDIKNLHKILTESGFSNNLQNDKIKRVFYLSASHQIWNYYKIVNNIKVTIDVNFDILWGEYKGIRIDMYEFLSDTVEMEVYNNIVKTLTPIKMIIQLILHHYKDMNSIFILSTRNSINYNMFQDLFLLFKNNLKFIPLVEFYNMCCKYSIIPYVFYVLYYTNIIFQDADLEIYVEYFRTKDGEMLLKYYGLTNRERKKWSVDFMTRLNTETIYELIKNDLTEDDLNKINFNKIMFKGE